MAQPRNPGLTTDQLIDLIRVQGVVPNSEDTSNDEDIIKLLNHELLITVVPSLIQAKEEYLVFPIKVPIVANKQRYPIPSRAISSRLRDLMFEDNNGSLFKMYKTHQEDVLYREGSNTSENNVRNYFFEGSSVVLTSKPNQSLGYLVFKVYIRPSTLVKEKEVAVIQTIDINTNTVSFTSNIPSTYRSSSLYDFVKSGSPHNILSIDNAPISVSNVTNTIVFSSLPDDLQVGDYVCLAGESCIPNTPTEMHMVLAQSVRHQIMESQGDSPGLQNATQRLNAMEGKTTTLIENRVDGSPTKIISRNIMFGRNKFNRRTF